VVLRNFKLAAVTGREPERHLRRIVLHQDLQRQLAGDWEQQLNQFMAFDEAVPFDPGYTPEDGECFEIADFEPPEWLTDQDSTTIPNCEILGRGEDALADVRGLAAFARRAGGQELVVFQNFTRGNIIRAGRFMLLQQDTFTGSPDPGLRLDQKLAAVYIPDEQRLLFQSFRITNTFISLAHVFAEASEEQIRTALAHPRLAPEDIDSLAIGASQWFRKRFALLQAQNVLDDYTPQQIQARARTCHVTVSVHQGRIVFPADKREAKRLLQFLNEELFRGPITDTLFATNSKREAE
jgi:hypothetical protein